MFPVDLAETEIIQTGKYLVLYTEQMQLFTEGMVAKLDIQILPTHWVPSMLNGIKKLSGQLGHSQRVKLTETFIMFLAFFMPFILSRAIESNLRRKMNTYMK